MRNECNIVKDMLPLYLEEMASDDTVSFIQEHLASCEQCRTEFEKMKNFEENRIFKDIDVPYDDVDVKPFKKIKLKIIKIIAIAVVLSVFLTITTVSVCNQFPPLRIDYGESETHSQEEMDSAIKIIKDTVFSWGGYVYYVSYSGDKTGKKELKYCNKLADEGVVYVDCMVFDAEFNYIIGEQGNRTYYRWYFGRTKGGDWELVSYGFG